MKTAVVALAILTLAGCTDAPPKSIQETHRDITKVSESLEGGVKALVVDMKPSAGYSDSSFFFMATEGVNKVLSDISKHFPNHQASRIDFVLTTGLTDNYGHSKDFPVIKLSFDMADVKKVNYKDGYFTSWDMLRLAQPLSFPHPSGKAIVRGYCADESNVKYAREFCRSFL